jgi:ABC-type glycerol-3-phosphate transport system substrate-binding protein
LAQRFPTFQAKQWPIPQVLSANNQEVTDFARMNVMTVPKASKNPAVAWNFVKFVSTVDQSVYTSATKRAGSNTNANYTSTGLTDRLGVNPDAVEKYTAQTVFKGQFPKNFDSAFNTAIDNVVFGRLPSQKALDLASDTITQLLRNTGY